jgi:hypothetical protein
MLRRIVLALSLCFATLAASSAPSTLAATERIEITPNIRSFDLHRFPEARARVYREVRDFPYLGHSFEVVDPYVGKRYNCIAHILGIHSTWVNPETGPATQPLVRMDRMYAAKGYHRIGNLDYRVVPGKQKVVVYATVSAGRIVSVTHAAVQERDGSWTSKLGQLPLIRHATPEALNGPSYGRPVAVYVRNG